MHRSRALRACAVVVALGALTAACGDDDEGGAETTTTEASTDVEVTAVDYEFNGIGDEIAVGSTLTLTNASTAEVHEIVAFKLPEGETRSAKDLVALPEAELGQLFAAGPVGVIVALPGEEGQVAVGSPTLTDPGRYLFVCTIPTGADPAAFAEALESGAQEAPDVPGGPPHFVNGMYDETTVS